ncbi:MAG: chemotaxis protein CheA [Cytophagales bacterium]|nr:chemotaxis protein CheA [Cytophagales bacterium]
MTSKDAEYRQLFLTEALENFEKLNNLFVELEQDTTNKSAVDSIFRIVHTLKGNSMLMGIDSIADLSHTMEDIFGALNNKEITMTKELMNSLFRANDALGGLINAVESGKKVSYIGIRTKLEVYLKNARNQDTSAPSEEEIVEEADKDIGTAREIKFADVVQIPVKKMDELLNLVGELVIERDRLITIHEANGKSTLEFEGLKRISSDLHYGFMNARMVQMGFLFNKFHRVLRDAAATENKDIKLSLKGTEVEIDRNILKIISDSLIHLIRNCASHGIENEEDRLRMGKPKYGTVSLDANHEKDNVILTVSDDGNGISTSRIREKIVKKKMVSAEVADKLRDSEIIRYIFEPGFTSAESVTEISGRGVGMDVVKRAVESIGGQVTVDTELGKGTSIHMVLPSSLALKGSLLFEVDHQEYAIPLTYIDSVIYFQKKEVHKISNELVVDYNNETVSISFLKDLLQLSSLSDIHQINEQQTSFNKLKSDDQLSVILTSHSGRTLGIVVDKLLRQKEIVEKKLPKPLNTSKILSGSTILGTGHVCPVIDVAAIMDMLFKSTSQN